MAVVDAMWCMNSKMTTLEKRGGMLLLVLAIMSGVFSWPYYFQEPFISVESVDVEPLSPGGDADVEYIRNIQWDQQADWEVTILHTSCVGRGSFPYKKTDGAEAIRRPLFSWYIGQEPDGACRLDPGEYVMRTRYEWYPWGTLFPAREYYADDAVLFVKPS